MNHLEVDTKENMYQETFDDHDDVYEESDTLQYHGGYMLIIDGTVHIMMNASLSKEEKILGRHQMLLHRKNILAVGGGIYWWCPSGGDQAVPLTKVAEQLSEKFEPIEGGTTE